MKAIVDKKNYKITLDKEAIKAIRFCIGANTDLRRKITTWNKNSLWYWLQANGTGLFGLSFCDLQPDPTSPEWYKYEKMLNDVVRQVLN